LHANHALVTTKGAHHDRVDFVLIFPEAKPAARPENPADFLHCNLRSSRAKILAEELR